MTHPYAKQSAASTARRMRVIGKGDGGKAWGSTALSKKSTSGSKYPSKNAGSQVPFFAEGGSVKPRADRYAAGGGIGKPRSSGGKGTTINVIVAPQEGGSPAAPAGPPPMRMAALGPPPGAVPAGGPPPGALVPPGAPPVGGPPLPRPPGMAKGGEVKKAQLGMAVPVRQAPPAVAAAPPPVAATGRAAAARKVGALAKRGALANKAAAKRSIVQDAAQASGPPLMKRGGSKKANGGKLASGGSIKQGGGGDAQYGEPGGYPVMKNAAGGGLGRLEKRTKGEV